MYVCDKPTYAEEMHGKHTFYLPIIPFRPNVLGGGCVNKLYTNPHLLRVTPYGAIHKVADPQFVANLPDFDGAPSIGKASQTYLKFTA
jgi:hypothetical protein